MLLTVDISSSASYFYFNVASNKTKYYQGVFLPGRIICVFVCSLGLTGFVQFIDIPLSNFLTASAYLTCKQYYNAAEKRKSNNSGYNA